MSSTANRYDRDVCTRNFPEAYAAGRDARLSGGRHDPKAHGLDLLSGEIKSYTFGWNEATTVSREEWNALHADYKTGDPRKGTAKMLTMVPGVGTCLVPVAVIG